MRNEQKKMIMVPLVISLFLFLFSCTTTASFETKPSESRNRSITISGYVFVLPSWWDSVAVEVPASLSDENAVRQYVFSRYGMDTGTEKTWREALKTWAIAAQRLSLYPVNIAHCYKTGKQYPEAARVYSDLYERADTQKANRDWYRVYLSYNAGEAYAKAGDKKSAKNWYTRAAHYQGNKDEAIDYYAKTSAKRLKELD